MFNLLILAYDYPPYNSVGALRPKSWAKYLTLLSELNTGLCIKNENGLYHVLKKNLDHFQKFGTVYDYSTKKDISFLSRDRQSLILKNKILLINEKEKEN